MSAFAEAYFGGGVVALWSLFYCKSVHCLHLAISGEKDTGLLLVVVLAVVLVVMVFVGQFGQWLRVTVVVVVVGGGGGG